MKKILKQFSQILGTRAILLVAAVACAASAGAASEKAPKATKDTAAHATTETNSALVEVTVQKSVFEDNLKSGKDPFYPKSTRRGEKESVPGVVVSPVVKLFLKGISGPTNRRFALINNQPLAVGEDGYVRVPGGQVKVHCWEIREDSVVISVEGNPEKKELRLREGL